ncbi:uroporphyrin-III C-methyltransferase [Nakamurella panacisegetis]|uniref:uroporphyrinogen-III C-methyltransferase n=1 Tax=Nakamurella panacisegetis TaxID=1090615 RepID=A0A1H0HZ74_9ACTN|nr:uroporphyrinogen-III C-methyltransferase [Nakamurella panacisegetis]SDO24444.1 uroporphyrin-III C-methyltransferase [Nakamurella panacisegetis]
MTGPAGDMRIDLPVRGRQVVVVGGGVAALGRIAALRAARADVVVFAVDPVASVTDFADRDLITLHQRDIDEDDLRSSWLVFAATGDADADAALVERAAAVGRFCLTGSGRAATEPENTRRKLGGRVVLVGGGPGDPGLLTLTGMRAIQEADVVIADRLAPLAVLQYVRPGAEIIDVAKIPRGEFTSQEEINRLLITHAKAGKSVVRLKGGDSFVFGRGGEEWQACAAEGIEVQLVPGVSSALAGPALAGIPVTHRSLNQGFTVVTGHVPPGDPRSTLDWNALAHTGTALIVMMGVANLAAIAATLIAAGMDPGTPAATVADAGHPGQRTVRARLADIADATTDAGLAPPAVTVIGSVAGFDPMQPE